MNTESPYAQVFDMLDKVEKLKLYLLSQLPEHNFERIYDDKPGVVGHRCRCGKWSGNWLGERCDGSDVPLPPGMRYEKTPKISIEKCARPTCGEPRMYSSLWCGEDGCWSVPG